MKKFKIIAVVMWLSAALIYATMAAKEVTLTDAHYVDAMASSQMAE
jgi:hypothetical protein